MSFLSFILFSLLTVFLTVLFIKILIPVAYRINFLDFPDGRKNHKGAIPLIGGVSAIVSYLISTKFFLPSNSIFSSLFIGAFILFLVGLYDDFKPLSAKIRLCLQFIATFYVLFTTEVSITSLGVIYPFGEIFLGPLSFLFTSLVVVLLVNAFNFIDGLDGLSGGLSIVALLGVICFQIISNTFHYIEYILFLILSILPFLLHNIGIYKDKIFLGDSGSMFLGFMIAWTLIIQSQSSSSSITPFSPLWCVAIPLLDTIGVILRRIRKKRSPFSPGHDHIHHILQRAGFSSRLTLMVIILFSLLIIFIGVLSQLAISDLSVYVFIIIIFFYYLLVAHAWRIQKFLKS